MKSVLALVDKTEKGKTMSYTKKAILKIKRKYANIESVHSNLLLKLFTLASKIKNENSREYLMEGVGRRLGILARCVYNVFKLFPVDRKELLTKDELADLYINLHAFFINISGVFDNLGWVFIYENDLFGKPKDGKLGKCDIGLFNKKTQAHLGPILNKYLKSTSLQNWYTVYSKNYRDALAHRIPLYVPPAALNNEESKRYRQIEERLRGYSLPEEMKEYLQMQEEQSKLGRPCVLFAHSCREECKVVYFHAQVIADFMTIEKIINIFCDEFTQ